MQILFCLFLLLTPIWCFVPLENFFPYGTTNKEQVMPPSDDGSSPAQNLSIPFPFFDKLYQTLWVNTNGAISFHSPIKKFTPTCSAVNEDYSMISPFWADIDTRNPMFGEAIYYGESSTEKDLKQAEVEVVNAFPNLNGIKLKSVFIVTWFNVTFYDARKHPTEKRNTFQTAIATNGIYTFTFFYYNEITWTTGDASNGMNGFGGTPAQAGFDAGDGKNRLMIDGSCNNAILGITNRSNVNFPGKWIFRVDSANIETAGCTTNFLPKDALRISPSHVTTLGQVGVEISGPCFKTTNISITCRIYDPTQLPYISIQGKIIGSRDSVKVICRMPFLFSTGRMKLELAIFDNLAPISFLNTTYHGYFYVNDLPPENSGLNLKVEKDENGIFATRTTFTWNPASFVNGTDFVDLNLIIFDLTAKPQVKNVTKIGDKIKNNGELMWQHSADNLTDLVYSEICSNLNVKIVFQIIEFGWDMTSGVDYKNHWYANSGIDANKFIGDFCESTTRASTCNDWFLTAENISASISQTCPPSSEQAAVDLRYIPENPAETAFYHPGEDICYQSIAPLENGEGQECCYKNGNIDCSFNGGHSQAFHSIADPFRHFSNDILPWIMCCYYQDGDVCGKYQAMRPCNPGNTYIPPGPAAAFGDPHLHTFDGLLYTFNGFGEFWILENSTSQPLAVQARMEPLNSGTESATVFSSFVFAAGDSVKIQVQKSAIRIVDIFINDQQLDITTPNSLKKLSIDGWQLIIADDFSEIQIGTSLEFSFKISTASGALGIFGTASPKWKTKTAGLFGNFNGNKSDDLTAKDGTVIAPNSSLQEIHANFGLSWAVTPETSLFAYFGGKTFVDYNHQNYTPAFDLNTSATSNSSQILCKNDWSCLFDDFYTQNTGIANFTFLSNQAYKNTVMILNKETQMCPSLMVPENGYANFSNYLQGSTAKFGCFTNYTINHNITFTCDNSYQWSPTNWSSIVCNYKYANFSSSNFLINFDVICLALIFYWFVSLP